MDSHLSHGINHPIDWNRNQYALQLRCATCGLTTGYWPVLGATHGHRSGRINAAIVTEALNELETMQVHCNIKLVKTKLDEVSARVKMANTLQSHAQAAAAPPPKAQAAPKPAAAPKATTQPQPRPGSRPRSSVPGSDSGDSRREWVFADTENVYANDYVPHPPNAPGQASGLQRTPTTASAILATCDHCQVELPETALQLEFTRCLSCHRLTEVQPRLRETVRPTRTPHVPKSSQQAEMRSAQELAEATSRLMQGHYLDPAVRQKHLQELTQALETATAHRDEETRRGTMETDGTEFFTLSNSPAPMGSETLPVPESPDAAHAPMCPLPAADAEDPQQLLDKREL